MLLGQFNLYFLENFPVVTLQISIQTSITVDNNEAEFVIVLKQHLKGLSLELVGAAVDVLVDGLEGLEVEVDHLLGLAVVHHYLAAEDHQAVLGRLPVELDLAQSRLDGRLDRVFSLRALYLGRFAELFS